MGFSDKPDSRPVNYGDLVAAQWFDEMEWKIKKVDDYGGTDVISMEEIETAHHVVLLKDSESWRKIIDDAGQAVFGPLTAAFPEVTTGDFDPESSRSIDAAIESAFILWLGWNHPGMR